VGQCGICLDWLLGVVSVCVCLYLLGGRVWVCCVVDRLLFLSLVCRNGACELRETHAGLSQAVSDSSTEAFFFLWLCFVICGL